MKRSTMSKLVLLLLLFGNLVALVGGFVNNTLVIQELKICDEVCGGCRRQCSMRKLDFYASRTFECLDALTELRANLPEWCTDDYYEYVATEQFVPTLESCNIDPEFCVKTVAKLAKDRLRSGEITRNDRFYRVSLMAKKVSEMQDKLAFQKQRLESTRNYVARVRAAYEGKWMDEAITHLKNPLESKTRFADPVFANYSTQKQENEAMDQEMSRQSLTYVRTENRFIKKTTRAKIPELLLSIANIENKILSKREDTEEMLGDIKRIAVEAAEFQKKATNIRYEMTHSAQVEGDVQVQDEELFSLYSNLQEERAVLIEAGKELSSSKLRMISLMRRLVEEITTRQLNSGCSRSELLRPAT